MSALVKSAAGVIALSATPDGLAVDTPYDPGFVAALKAAVPASARRWDGQRKRWLIDPAHVQKLPRLIEQHYGATCTLPAELGTPQAPVTVTEVVQLAYLGACRERYDGASLSPSSVTASGYTLGNRNPKAPDVVFPESALKAWFKVSDAKPGQADLSAPDTLYSALCVAADVDEAALKAAYRRMARQTHPDVNREPDAAEQFRRVQAAYDTLRDPLKRRKYDAGLALEARSKLDRSSRTYAYVPPPQPFRAPLRCGLLLVAGERRLGRLTVTQILSWEDLTRDGRVLVSSWPADADRWTEQWVTP